MFLDQRSFQDKGLSFIVRDDELDVGDLVNQFFGLDSVTEFAATARLKV